MIGKLYKQMFKECLKPILIAFGLAWVFLGLFMFSSRIQGQGEWTSLLFVLQFIILTATHLAIFFITVVQDYKNMEGARAYFYRSIPATGRQFTAARTFYYLTFSLLTLISAIAQVFLLILTSLSLFAQEPGNPPLEVMLSFLGQILKPLLLSPSTPLYLLSIFISILFSAAMLSFSVTVGSAWVFRKLGAGGPVVVYVLVQFLQSLATIIFGQLLGIPTSEDMASQIDALPSYLGLEESIQIISDSFYRMISSQMPVILFSLVLTFLFWAVTIYTTDRKISIR